MKRLIIEWHFSLSDMTISAQKFEHVVIELLPHFLKPNFEARLDALSSKYTSTEVFMIKMEINRRMTPCSKRLDLRGRVPGEVREYELENERCWLDDIALNHYRKRIEFYGGSLTHGLWEELQPKQEKRNVLLKPTQHKAEPTANFSAEYFKSGAGILRKESRYKFFATIELVLPDGCLVHGNTLDISSSGLKIKATAAFDYHVDDEVTIRFPKLDEAEEMPELIEGITYTITQIRDYSYSSHFMTLGLKIVSPSKAIGAVIDNRHRNKKSQKPTEDSNHQIDNIRHRALEKVVVNHTTTLALFLEFGAIRFALMTLMNRGIWDYWHNEKGEQFFSQLLSEGRLQSLQKERELIFYCFCRYKKDQKYYVCASDTELSEQERKHFWSIGINEPSWRILRLRLSAIEKDELKDSPTDMAALSHIVLIQDLTDHDQRDDYQIESPEPEVKTELLNRFSRSLYNSSRISPINPDIQSQFADLLRKISVDHFDSTSYFLGKKDMIYSAHAFVINTHNNFLNQILLEKKKTSNMSLQPLYHDELMRLIKKAAKKNSPPPISHIDFYIAIFPAGKNKVRSAVRTFSEFSSPIDRVNFIINARKMGSFVAVRNTLQPIRRVYDYADNRALSPLLTNSRNQITLLQHEMNSICVFGELTNITQEVLKRYLLGNQ
ncbi:PilZ domain-containing protein [Veronia pacifica]|uniref:PilZ domain-containing protein n=1 Tax=Veronia pacifica TaxID=1080227 RepID=A0A1C3EK57_9GAMM|nr:PilZ domain-containing protein [Veronia pacifica]ODA33621.1 hypothetical protein A8L45_09565 [Veronia pacifica]